MQVFDSLVVPIALYGSVVWWIGKHGSRSIRTLAVELYQGNSRRTLQNIKCCMFSRAEQIALYTRIKSSAKKHLLQINESNNALALKIYNATEKKLID